MLERLKLLWKLWSIEKEVRDMDKKALLKVLIAGLAAAVATGAASYLGTDTVSWAAVGTAALTAIGAYLKQSPIVK